MQENKPETLRNFFLQSLDRLICKLDNLTTLITEDVIVVLLNIGVLVTGMSIRKMLLFSELAFLKELHRPIHGRIAHPWIDSTDLSIEVVDTQMSAAGEKRPRDIISL